MILTYIWHDCFVLTTESAILVFDYWKDPFAGKDNIPDFIKNADSGKPLYVIASHHHKDHYTTKIFDWLNYLPDVHYILSRDIEKFSRHVFRPDSVYGKPKPTPGQVSILQPGDRFEDGVISVEAFGSTDIGNSYMVTIEGQTVFHAGDLNAWIWKDESTPEEVEKAIDDFKAILGKIAVKYPVIDFAMFPVDSRIGSDYFEGARIFVRAIDVRHFFPMHFGLGETSEEQLKFRLDAAKVSCYANPARGEYICLQSPYSCFVSPFLPKETGEK